MGLRMSVSSPAACRLPGHQQTVCRKVSSAEEEPVVSTQRIRSASLVLCVILVGACATTPTQSGAPGAAGSQAAAPTANVETRNSETVSGGEVVTLTAWTIGPDAPSYYRRDNLIDAAKALNTELEAEGSNQRVQVTASFESGGQWADYKQKFTLAAEAGEAPDIILAGHEDMAPWAAAGYVVKLDDYIQKYPIDDVIDVLWTAMELTGETYAVPQDTEARPMYFRKDLLAKLGWSQADIDSLPDRVRDGQWTMEDLVATAKDAIAKGVVAEGKGWYHRPTRGNDFYMFYFLYGGTMQDEASGKLVVTKSALEQYFQLHYDAVNTSKITPKNFMGSDARQWHETVTAGTVLFYNAGTWTWKDWQATYKVPAEDLEKNVGFMLIPAAKAGSEPITLSHPLAYMVTANSKQPELAYRLIRNATTPELNSRHAVESAHLAVLTSQAADPTYASDQFLLDTSYMVDHTTFIPNHPKFGTYDEVLFRFLSAVEAAELEPAAATEAAITELQAQLGADLIVQ
jgi:inositol-phosphate transport system substrate-binding protein